jgi:putative SOS response-associated peptidase YedK
MCGRFTHRYTWADIHRLYRLTSPASNVQPSYNVCPTDTVNVVTASQDIRILQPMRWGLIPRWWSKPLKDLMRLSTFNARVETVTTKPFFREAFKRTRCIIPASGYYEWQDWFVVVQYADQTAYEKAQAAIAQDPECQQIFAEIAKFAKRVSREMVIDLDL